MTWLTIAADAGTEPATSIGAAKAMAPTRAQKWRAEAHANACSDRKCSLPSIATESTPASCVRNCMTKLSGHGIFNASNFQADRPGASSSRPDRLGRREAVWFWLRFELQREVGAVAAKRA